MISTDTFYNYPLLIKQLLISPLSSNPNQEIINDDGIGLNYKDAKSKALGWLDELGDPYSISIFDYKGDIALDMGVTGAPETFLVKNGKIVMHHLGELNKEIWEQKFEPHL